MVELFRASGCWRFWTNDTEAKEDEKDSKVPETQKTAEFNVALQQELELRDSFLEGSQQTTANY